MAEYSAAFQLDLLKDTINTALDGKYWVVASTHYAYFNPSGSASDPSGESDTMGLTSIAVTGQTEMHGILGCTAMIVSALEAASGISATHNYTEDTGEPAVTEITFDHDLDVTTDLLGSWDGTNGVPGGFFLFGAETPASLGYKCYGPHFKLGSLHSWSPFSPYGSVVATPIEINVTEYDDAWTIRDKAATAIDAISHFVVTTPDVPTGDYTVEMDTTSFNPSSAAAGSNHFLLTDGASGTTVGLYATFDASGTPPTISGVTLYEVPFVTGDDAEDMADRIVTAINTNMSTYFSASKLSANVVLVELA